MSCKERFVVVTSLTPMLPSNVLEVGSFGIKKVSSPPPNESMFLVDYCRWAEREGFGVYESVVTCSRLYCQAWKSLQEIKE